MKDVRPPKVPPTAALRLRRASKTFRAALVSRHMELGSVDIKGRDLIGVVACIVALIGAYTNTLPTEIAIAIIMAVLAGYGFSTARHRQKRRKGE